jgi:protein SCO1/2
MSRKFVAALAVALVALAGCASSSEPLAEIVAGNSPSGLRGDVLSPPTVEPSIVLSDDHGGTYNVLKQTKGQVTLLYFGYTHCPDICPAIMADTAQAIRQSSPTVRAKVTVVFISVDPHRDTRPVLRAWLNHFNPAFVGLRGSIRRVIKIQRELDVPVSKVTHGKHYTVEHSAELLAFTPDHKAHVLYTDGPTTISDLQHDLALLTTDKAWGA